MGKDITYRVELEGGEATRRALMRLGDDGQKALARIERASAPASKGLLAVNAVSRQLQGHVQGFASRIGLVGSGLMALGPAGLAAAAGIGVFAVGLTAAMRAARNALAEIDALDDAASTTGFGVERLQELRYAAEQSGVSIQQLDDGLRRMTRRVGLFAQDGGGPAAKAFQQLGLSVRDVHGNMRSSEAIFDEVVKKLQGLESQAERSALASQIFGDDAGPKLTLLLNKGAAGIQRLTAEARSLGLVLDSHLVSQAEKANDRLATMQRIIDMNMNSALVDLAPLLVGVASGFAEIAKWVAEVVDGFREIENRTTRGLESRLVELQNEIELLHRRRQIVLTDFARENVEQQIREKYGEIQRINEVLRGRMEEQEARKSSVGSFEPSGQADQQADKIKKVTDALKGQLEQLDRTEYGKRVFQELQRAGIDANHREAQAIASLVFEIYQYEQAEKQAADAKQKGEAMTKSVMTAEEKRAQAIEEINRLLAAGVISEETAARARDKAAQDFESAEMQKLRASREAGDGIRRALMDLRDASTNMAQQWESDIQGMNQTARSAFVDITTGAKSMSDGLMSILNDLQRRIMGRVWDRTMGSLLDGIIDIALDQVQGAAFSAGMGRSGISSGISTPSFTLHTGGTVGKDSSGTRFVAPDLFAGAPRFHGGGLVPGLRPGEMPIIAMNGERVLTEAQQANTARTIAGLAALAKPSTPGVSVTVNNTAGRVAEARANVSQGRDGGIDLEIIVEEIEHRITRNVARGEGMAGTLERRYGLDPAVGARR
ncbi:MAG: phage tail tape measure protein [Rhodospirillales bacterium CG15_BIG_FIL_POST_REV_8_21_14_020_66_15]|nr:MAG: phage tail tape measure protein [Rhodospirillales bacterium CG15_BIG_FIL_POST_REV_8_21_14_020_66_15]